MAFIKTHHKILFNLALIGLVIFSTIFLYLDSKLPTVAVLKDIKLQVPLKIYSNEASGKLLIAEYGDKRCTPISVDAVPKDLINAIIATEDRRYFSHPGVDLRGLLRAAISLIITGNKEQGGSTITMQVARNFFLTRKKTYLRKINEILLALKIEKELSKQEILELYLNKIYFGKHAYGISAAAEVYYGKTVDQLDLAQMAMLAGLPQAPSSINPINAPQAALKRRSHVLERMLSYGFITEEQFIDASNQPIETKYHGRTVELEAPYVAEMVRQELASRFGDEIYDRGYEVITTIDANLQNAANNAVQKALNEYQRRHPENKDVEGALVAINPQTGALGALVGGTDFQKSSFNRATQAERQPGSGFKPFIYSAALEKGFTAATIVNDAPIVYEASVYSDEWRPQNSTKKFYGPIPLRTGIVNSRNLVSIRVLDSIGIEKAIEFIGRCGFPTQKIPRGLSLALGTNQVSPLEMAQGFSLFANGGYKISPFFIDSIYDYQGNLLLKITPAEKTAVISPQIAYLMNTMLQDAIKRGTGRRAMELERKDLAGKTGSTNDHFDAWYNGYNADLVAITWMGFDEPRSLEEFAATAALPMWIYFMKDALKDRPEHVPERPDGLISVKIDPASGLLARPNQKDAVEELFITETIPTEIAPEHVESERELF